MDNCYLEIAIDIPSYLDCTVVIPTEQNLSKMRESNDPNGSEVTNLCSLGVVDLDLSLCPDVFGLKAFDEKMPITRMLPGSSPCELRLLPPGY